MGEHRAQGLGHSRGLRRLAAAVDPLQGDQAAPAARSLRASGPAALFSAAVFFAAGAAFLAAVFLAGASSWPPSSWRRSSWPPPSWPDFLARLLGPGPARRGAGGPPVGQELGGPLDGHRLDVVALAQRGVGGPVGHVRPEPALAQHHRRPGFGVGAELA